MRVLHLVRALDVGGLERVVLDLLKGLEARGVTCHVGCLSHPGTQIDLACKDGLWVGGLGSHGRFRTLLSLCCYVRRHRIDIIHSHNPTPHLFAVFAGLLTRVSVVHTKHGRNYPDNPRWVWLSRQLSRFTFRIAAVSQDAADVALQVERVPADKVEVLHNGVRIEDYTRDESAGLRFRREFDIPETALVIGSVGRLSPEKRYDLLVQAFAEFLARYMSTDPATTKPPVLVIVGDGADRGRIEAVVSRLGLEERVILPGMSNRVADWLQTMDIFSLSSQTEGTSITLLEAAACSIPSVVSDVGGNREIVRGGEGGLLVPFGAVEGMAECFMALAVDEDLRRRMGEDARRSVAEDYSVSQMVERYAVIYRDALVAGSPLRCFMRSLRPGNGVGKGGS